MKIAILYICTGKYNQFWTEFYKSSELFFLTNHKKHYFVFTDDISISTIKNVTISTKVHRGFPLDSLFRFDMFLEREAELKEFDYIFFFNANMQFIAKVGEDFLPKKEDNGLAAVIHPGYFNKPAFLYPYERNKKSKAYIPNHLKSYNYFMGSLNGGIAKDYLELIRICSQNINCDYEKSIIAVFHDESHLNKYLSEHECLKLSPEYAFPEDSNLPFDAKILIRNKVKIDKYFDKHDNERFWVKIIRGFNIITHSLKWYF